MAAGGGNTGRQLPGQLFDLSFTRYITPSIVKAVYVLIMVVIVLGWIAYTFAAFVRSPGAGLLFLLGGALVGLLYLVVARITLELYLAVIRIAEDVRELKERSATPPSE